jgi:maltose alpha-D-glucosyltransferase/alpha-amylase
VRQQRDQTEPIPLEDDPLWYRDAIIYELHVRAFADSDGDGVGDFRGLVQKLDYLQDLGITALWLLPFYPSPLRDDGYDIADYTKVHPYYGTLSDFRVFLREAHRRGLRVITELVLNHTSDQHPWFQQARQAKPGSPARDFYVWSDTADKYPEARIIFKDFEHSNWAWDSMAKAYYWHRFYSHQPDLNFDNPQVHEALRQVVDFWLNMGIDGLRLDAVPYLYEREGTNCENLPETHTFLRELRRHVDAGFKNRMLLAEANQWPEDSVAYFGRGDECHMAFHFPVMPRLFMAIRMEDRLPIVDILQQTPAIPETNQWALFLRNHDELTLEMVTDEDRDYMYRVYAQDPQARINLGIRRRLAPLLENHRGKIELMNGLLFSLPGTPVLYYGDEIGMGDNIYLGDRNGVRTPMQWSSERNAGFSHANPQRLYLPVIIDPEYHFEALNVQAQQNNPHSLLWWMKHLLALRKRHQAFGRGTLEFLHPENHKVLAFVRRYQDERILVVANLSRFVQYTELDLAAFKGLVPVEMLGRTAFPPIGEQPFLVTLGSYAFYWFMLEVPRAPTVITPPREVRLPALKVVGDWDNLFRGKAQHALEEILPSYLARCSWLGKAAGQIKAVRIQETIPVAGLSTAAQVGVLQVELTDGEVETCAVPFAFASGPPAEQLQNEQPQAIICRLHVELKSDNADGPLQGLLYDAAGEKAFSQALLDAIRRRRRFKGIRGELQSATTTALRQLGDSINGPPEPAQWRTDLGRSAMVYADRLLLKFYHRLEEGVNPELEVGRFLTEKVAFPHAPPVAGALEYHLGRGAPMTVALFQGFVHSQGSAWQLTVDALGRSFEAALAGSANLHDLPLPHRSLVELATGEIPARAQEIIGSYLESARLLGVRTAELHAALASVPDDPKFSPEPFTAFRQRSLYQTARTQARQAFELLRKRQKALPPGVREDAQKLLGREEELLDRIHTVLDGKLTARLIRCHGNYHLGQVLYTGKDFILSNFEGNPARPLSERRRKRSPLRDVADMLRSFHCAAQTALAQGSIRPEDVPTLEFWVRCWRLWVSVAFFKAYLEVAGRSTFLPKTSQELSVLLHFYQVKRAMSELRYELEQRLDWVKVPLRGLLELLEAQG